ncbi:MAG TPA: hypothetical protein VMT16_05605, partial [Thermoanaerobaculia bacterium]|nr:hypothetical protein [Thermoanaerobaculia bacterium]
MNPVEALGSNARRRWWLLAAVFVLSNLCLSPLLAQPTLHDAEPNDMPAQAQRVAGEVRIVGSLAKDDQDGYLWTVADTDAVTRWNLELHGIPGHLTKVEVVRLEWAEDGQGVARKQVLASFGSRDGTRPGRLDQVLFEPGAYLLGVAKSGGEGQYRLDIGKGARVPTARGSQGQATRDTAGRMRGGAAYTAYLETPEAWWRWELAGDDAGRRWALTATVPLGRRAVLALHDAAGRKLADVRADDRGHFALPDLALEPGAYLVQLRREGEEGMVALLEAHTTGARVAGQEEEPNDTLRDANVVDLAQPVTGRMGRAGDTDSFRFTMGEDGAETLHELRLEGEWQGLMRLCLVDDAGQPLQCRDSQEDMALPDLLFEPGEHRVTVSRAQEGGTYRLSLTATGRFEPGREAEPNDTPATATGMSGRTAKGTLAGRDDVDVFRFTVDEEPQLWRLQAIGEGLTLTYHDGSGRRVQEMRPGKGQRRTRLSNLFLLPGSHYAAVSGPRGGDYTLRVLPIGPPDPLMEREPND